MILSAAQTELRARGFSYLTTGRDVIMLNRGKNALESLYPWPWLEANATGTGTVTLTDQRAIQFVMNTGTKVELEGAQRDWLRQTWGPDLTITGTAQYWWLDGDDTLRIYPVQASAALSVDYIKWSPELVDVSDTPLIPTREHSVWIDFAVIEAYKDNKDYASALALQQNLLTTEIPRMCAAYLGRNYQNAEENRIPRWAVDS